MPGAGGEPRLFGELSQAIAELKRDEVRGAVKRRAEAGEDPLSILKECRQGLSIIGDRYLKGDCSLAELVLAGEILKEITAVLQPYLQRVPAAQPLAKVVLAVLKGDIHDQGKNILAMLLEAHGFEVHDLGVDVDPELVVRKVKEIRPQFVAFSALMTPSYLSMKEAAVKLEEAGLRSQLKLMIGGGVTTPTVREYVGADFQACDAMEAVTYCLRMVGAQ